MANIWIFFFCWKLLFKIFFSNFYKSSLKHYSYGTCIFYEGMTCKYKAYSLSFQKYQLFAFQKKLLYHERNFPLAKKRLNNSYLQFWRTNFKNFWCWRKNYRRFIIIGFSVKIIDNALLLSTPSTQFEIWRQLCNTTAVYCNFRRAILYHVTRNDRFSRVTFDIVPRYLYIEEFNGSGKFIMIVMFISYFLLYKIVWYILREPMHMTWIFSKIVKAC